MIEDSNTLPAPVAADARGRVSTIAQLASIPEEEIWLSKQKSARTRRAYRLDVQHFMRTLGIATLEELHQADHKAVIAWERYMREVEGAASSTIRRRLAALSSLFKHLVRHSHAPRNPVGEVERPAINRDEGASAAFSKAQARKMLDLPSEDTIAGLRDRAILSVGGPAGDPARAVQGKAAAGDEAMNVRMVLQVLTPGVEHADEADLGAEMLGIGGDHVQRLGRGPEQDGVDRFLVLESDLGGRRWQGEDDVETRRWQQLALPRDQPGGARWSLAFRAMPVAARVISDPEAALCTAFDMTTERRRAARLDRPMTRRRDRDDRHAPGDRPRRGGGKCPPPRGPA